jgi:dimethylaniline monooxygenase (N-oxide forming)
VDIYRNDIREMEELAIRLEDGSSIPTDTLLCGTGWQLSHGFFTIAQLVQLGLPHAFDQGPPEEEAKWAKLMEEADAQVTNQFPILAHPPGESHSKTTPYRLYNSIAPLSDDSIVFLGAAVAANTFFLSEVQAIWAVAYLDKKLKIPSLQEMEKHIAWTNAFIKRRYPVLGNLGTKFHLDMLDYCDKLLEEVGLSSYRKGWWRDLVEVCTPSDLRGLKDEYLEKYGKSSDERNDQ